MTTPSQHPIPAGTATVHSTTATGGEHDAFAVDASVAAFLEMAREGVSTSVLAATFELDEATVRDLLGRRDLPASGQAA